MTRLLLLAYAHSTSFAQIVSCLHSARHALYFSTPKQERTAQYLVSPGTLSYFSKDGTIPGGLVAAEDLQRRRNRRRNEGLTQGCNNCIRGCRSYSTCQNLPCCCNHSWNLPIANGFKSVHSIGHPIIHSTNRGSGAPPHTSSMFVTFAHCPSVFFLIAP
jgi:hypothetical protein